MNFENDVRDDLQDHMTHAPQEREISLGTSTILGIFFGLALLCAAFFGFGYSMGHKASLPPVAAAESSAAPKKDTFSSFKTTPAPAPKSVDIAAATTATAPDSADVADAPAKPATAEPVAGDQPPPSADGIWTVQVSVSSVKPDAEKLTGVLTRQGFPATMSTTKDGKFHIRVGPFATKTAADTTRKMLVADGYKEPYISNH